MRARMLAQESEKATASSASLLATPLMYDSLFFVEQHSSMVSYFTDHAFSPCCLPLFSLTTSKKQTNKQKQWEQVTKKFSE